MPLGIPVDFASEQSPLNLIAVDRPSGVGLLLTPIQFQVRSGTDLFDELAESERLLAVTRARGDHPASGVVASET